MTIGSFDRLQPRPQAPVASTNAAATLNRLAENTDG